MSRALVVIPARLGATRFPGKVLADLDGKPVVRHCWEAAKAAGFDVLVATESPLVVAAVEKFGGRAVLTSPSCQSGTDRVWEAVRGESRADKIVNVQGDEPFMLPATIAAVARLLDDPGAEISTAVTDLDSSRAAEPSVVKAALGKDGRCLDFFRRPPSPAMTGIFQHIGIYGYTREALKRFVGLAPSKRELEEKLEQLRAMDNGMKICAAQVKHVPIAIDTPEDLRRAAQVLQGSKHG